MGSSQTASFLPRAAASYIPALDGVRGVAVMLVLVSHAPGIPFPTVWGFIGVDIFFVLSGYLITSLLLREFAQNGRISLPRFYMRRFLRLMPALWVMVLVTLAVLWIADNNAFHKVLHEVPWVLLYIGNWAWSFGRLLTYFLHTWSLAVEEQFYLLWPALVWLCMARGGVRRVLHAALALALLSWLWRAALLAHGEHWIRIYHGLDTRLDAPMWGCALAAWMYDHQAPQSTSAEGGVRLAVVATLAAVLFLMLWLGLAPGEALAFALYQKFGSVMVAWLTARMIFDVVYNSSSILRPLLCWPPLVWCGAVSYGLYLWNYVVAGFVQTQLSLPEWGQAAAFFVFSVIMTLLSFCFVERPFLRLKKRFEVVSSR